MISSSRWMGIALLPQAGVALGMALMAARRFPEIADVILPVVIGATVIFELAGPVLTRRAILWSGEDSVGHDTYDPDGQGTDGAAADPGEDV